MACVVGLSVQAAKVSCRAKARRLASLCLCLCLTVIVTSCDWNRPIGWVSSSPPSAAPEFPATTMRALIVWLCVPRSDRTNIERWDLVTGESTELGTLSGCRATGPPGPENDWTVFPAQRALQRFDPSRAKEVVDFGDGSVGYVESASGVRVNVSKRIEQSQLASIPFAADFLWPATHSNPMFNEAGRFVYFDKTGMRWNFVDIGTMSIVSSWPRFGGSGAGPEMIFPRGYFGPEGEIENADPVDGETSLLGRPLCGRPIWWIDGQSYLTDVRGALTIVDRSNADGLTSGRPVSTPAQIRSAIGNRNGIFYLISGPAGLALHQANPANPGKPRRIRLQHPPADEAAVMFVGIE